jgi:MarR family transcriptional regulator, organic hydroperoxide resistance regulator
VRQRITSASSQQASAMKALPSKLQNLTEDQWRTFWATVFGITGPEWMIILTLADAEKFTASIDTLSNLLKVNQSFVRIHARHLEKQKHIYCSVEDEGVVSLSLTEAAQAKLGNIDAG